jgi:hypothetical protein
MVYKSIFSLLHCNPLHVAVKLDAVNAFNEISREQVFAGARKYAPFLLPYLYSADQIDVP